MKNISITDEINSIRSLKDIIDFYEFIEKETQEPKIELFSFLDKIQKKFGSRSYRGEVYDMIELNQVFDILYEIINSLRGDESVYDKGQFTMLYNIIELIKNIPKIIENSRIGEVIKFKEENEDKVNKLISLINSKVKEVNNGGN